jgi:hypothetical protein
MLLTYFYHTNELPTSSSAETALFIYDHLIYGPHTIRVTEIEASLPVVFVERE